MSRDTDWHVFDKACDVTAMAVRGAAESVAPDKLADVFREMHKALKETADAMDSNQQKTGF
jgi:hypothetical protein